MRLRPRVPSAESELVARLLTTILREDLVGLRSRGRLFRAGDGHQWLALNRLRIPVRTADPARGDLVCDLAVRAPVVLRAGPGRRLRAGRLHAVLTVLATELVRGLDPAAAAELTTGFRVLREEAIAALAGAGLRRRRRPLVFGRLRAELAGRPGLGWPGAIGFETLAAHRDHPLYPFSLARVGLPAAQLAQLAPEHRPDLELTWLVLPAATELHGRLPDWWPAVDGVALPVHPAVPAAAVQQALDQLGVSGPRFRGPVEGFRPTLSLRTVAAARYPAVHLKLPMPVRTLGHLNLRTLTRRGLLDGGLVGGLLRTVLGREPEFTGAVRIADESSWLHAGHPLLAVLVRRWGSDDLGGAAIVPVAGLAGTGPDGCPVFEHLARRFADGDLDQLIVRYLRLVIGWQVQLWLRYGIVLESHPQNVLLAVDRTGAGPRVRLLLRDLDSAKLDLAVLADRLGATAPVAAEVSDERLVARDPGELRDLFVTTTLHQCVAAVLIDLAAALGRPARPLLDLVGPLLGEAAERYPQARDTRMLKTEVIGSSRLPVKRALTAATLLPKTRTGAADVNKYYGADAPSYL